MLASISRAVALSIVGLTSALHFGSIAPNAPVCRAPPVVMASPAEMASAAARQARQVLEYSGFTVPGPKPFLKWDPAKSADARAAARAARQAMADMAVAARDMAMAAQEAPVSVASEDPEKAAWQPSMPSWGAQAGVAQSEDAAKAAWLAQQQPPSWGPQTGATARA